MKKNDDWDNGMTVAPMNGDELPSYRRATYLNRAKKSAKIKSDVTKKERRAMTKALFAVMLPRLFVMLAGFGLTALLIWFWLS
ncbi:MAG: hypothetical protein ACI4SK_00965 [Christensenellales bacterium]